MILKNKKIQSILKKKNLPTFLFLINLLILYMGFGPSSRVKFYMCFGLSSRVKFIYIVPNQNMSILRLDQLPITHPFSVGGGVLVAVRKTHSN